MSESRIVWIVLDLLSTYFPCKGEEKQRRKGRTRRLSDFSGPPTILAWRPNAKQDCWDSTSLSSGTPANRKWMPEVLASVRHQCWCQATTGSALGTITLQSPGVCSCQVPQPENSSITFWTWARFEISHFTFIYAERYSSDRALPSRMSAMEILHVSVTPSKATVIDFRLSREESGDPRVKDILLKVWTGKERSTTVKTYQGPSCRLPTSVPVTRRRLRYLYSAKKQAHGNLYRFRGKLHWDRRRKNYKSHCQCYTSVGCLSLLLAVQVPDPAPYEGTSTFNEGSLRVVALKNFFCPYIGIS